MKLLIALHHRFDLWCDPSWFAPRLVKEFPQLTISRTPDYDHVAAEIPDADIMLGWSLRPEQFRLAKRLRWIHSTAAAVHQLMSPELVVSGVIVTNAREVHGPVVAEHVIALVFALAKRLTAAAKYQQQKLWAQEQLWEQAPAIREVAGGTLVLVGVGSIGREVIRRAKPLGMHVLAVREHPQRGTEGADQVFGMEQLDSALAQADFVVLAAPLTRKTEGMINTERLRSMKPEAYLINVSRGPLIDDAALVAALRARQIAGAALDVFAQEPLPADSPYWELDNCFITPHTAAVTDKLWERHYELFTENLRRFLKGETLLGIVDKQRGY